MTFDEPFIDEPDDERPVMIDGVSGFLATCSICGRVVLLPSSSYSKDDADHWRCSDSEMRCLRFCPSCGGYYLDESQLAPKSELEMFMGHWVCLSCGHSERDDGLNFNDMRWLWRMRYFTTAQEIGMVAY